MATPKWVNTERKNQLVKLFLVSAGYKCIFGHANCYIPEHRYDLYIEDLISDWKTEDRLESNILWQLELKALHSLGETRLPVRGRFSNIARDIFFANQPLYYLEGIGVSVLTFKPFAKVKLASSYKHLYITLGDSLRKLSKNRKRKAIRYHKPLPVEIDKQVNHIVGIAVRDYLK